MTDHAWDDPRRVSPLTEDYLRQIEEGEVVPTPEDLDLLGDAYELNQVARRFLRQLHINQVNGAAPIPELVVSDIHRHTVEGHPGPAAVLDHRWNIVCANTDYRRVLRGIEVDGDNFLDWIFLDDNAISIVVDFAAEARHLVGRFQFACAAHSGDPEIKDLLQRCYSNDLFAAAWDDVAVLADGPAVTPMHWRDPGTGQLWGVTEERVPDNEWLTLHLAAPTR